MSIPIFVISLPDAQDRRTAMSDRLSALGLSFRFFDAVDGRNGFPAIDGMPQINLDGFPSNTAVACTLSHYLLHKHIAQQGCEWALILEDDVAFATDVPEVISFATQFTGFDIVKLEGLRPIRYFVPLKKEGAYLFAIPHAISAGAAGYMLSKRGAEKFSGQSCLDKPIDDCFENVALACRALEVDPQPIWQDRAFGSSNVPVRSMSRPGKLKKVATLFANSKNSVELHGLKFVLSIARQRLHSTVARAIRILK